MDKFKKPLSNKVGVNSFLAAESLGLGNSKEALKRLWSQLEPGDLCLVNRNNEQLFSTYSEQENDLFELIGFSGSSGLLLVRRSEIILLVDQRYLESARRQYAKTHLKVEERSGKAWVDHFLLPWAERFRGRGGARCILDKSRWAASDVEELKERCGLVQWEHRHFGQRRLSETTASLSWSSETPVISNLHKIQRCIKASEIHLFTCADDLAWLTGARSNHFDFRRSIKAVACVSKKDAVLFGPASCMEHGESSLTQLANWTLVPDQQAWSKGLKSLLKKSPKSRCMIAFHPRPGGLNEHDHEKLSEDLNGHKIVKVARSLAELGRLEKNPWELHTMAQSQAKLARVMTELIDYIHHEVGAGRELRECQVLEHANTLAQNLGANRPCFPGIVASGEHTLHPHHSPTRRLIKKGEPVLLDIGYYFDEGLYATDMSRSIWSDGHSRPHPRVVAVYSAVLVAFLRQWGFSAQQNQFRADHLDKIGRDTLKVWEKEGFGFIHSTGHGVGISDHELGITIGPQSRLTLRPGYVYSLEPGLYRNKASSDPALRFGVRLEDVVAVEGDASLCRHRSLGPAEFEKCLIDAKALDDSDHFLLETYLRLVR